MKYEPPARTIRNWLRLNLGPGALGVLTGTDVHALEAAVSIVATYNRADQEAEAGLLDAFRAVVLAMGPNARHLAYHAIAHVLDWHNRASFWARAGLDPIPVGRCANE